MRFEAHERNRVSTNALPETFVDHAEEIWDLLAIGKTQQVVADEMGWSRDKVKNYSALKKVNGSAWKSIGTAIRESVPISNLDVVPSKGTGVPITESLLRNILNLNNSHQSKIVEDLISGKIKNGQVITLDHLYICMLIFM